VVDFGVVAEMRSGSEQATGSVMALLYIAADCGRRFRLRQGKTDAR